MDVFIRWLLGLLCFGFALQILTGSFLAGVLIYMGGLYQMELTRRQS